jgi:apolipoprotein D and lipocalin family protein
MTNGSKASEKQGEENVAMLKCHLLGLFGGGYNVVAIDKEYKYVLVAGGSL